MTSEITKTEAFTYHHCLYKCPDHNDCLAVSFKSHKEAREVELRARKFVAENEDEYLDYMWGDGRVE